MDVRCVGRPRSGRPTSHIKVVRTCWPSGTACDDGNPNTENDVIQADGGTRTASITGAYVALYQAFQGLVRDKKIKQVIKVSLLV